MTSTSNVDSENVDMEPDRSSTAGIFYRNRQSPVDAVDMLQIITDNLEILKKEDFTHINTIKYTTKLIGI